MTSAEHILNVLAGIAVSKWSESQRRALVRILLAPAELSFATEDFVPAFWNRRAKAAKALRELEKANCLVRNRDSGRWLVIESSFCVSHDDGAANVQLALPEERGLAAAIAKGCGCGANDVCERCAELCPVQDGTVCPSQDGRSVSSETGPEKGGAEKATGAMGLAVARGASQVGPPRASNGMESSSTQFDVRRRLFGDMRLSADPEGSWNARKDYHRDTVLELLAKNPHLSGLRVELNKRKSPTAVRFWQLFETNPVRAARLIKEVADKKKPGAFLNRCLMNETIGKPS